MPAVIGTRAVAEAALFAYRANVYNTEPWRLLGSGSIRYAILHTPTNVVYKVEHRDTTVAWTDYSNRVELQNGRRLRRMAYPDGWWSTRVRIPRVSGFRFGTDLVVAMEYVKHTPSLKVSRMTHTELWTTGISDMHSNNWAVDAEGTVWPIDLGSYMYNRRDDWHDD